MYLVIVNWTMFDNFLVANFSSQIFDYYWRVYIIKEGIICILQLIQCHAPDRLVELQGNRSNPGSQERQGGGLWYTWVMTGTMISGSGSCEMQWLLNEELFISQSTSQLVLYFEQQWWTTKIKKTQKKLFVCIRVFYVQWTFSVSCFWNQFHNGLHICWVSDIVMHLWLSIFCVVWTFLLPFTQIQTRGMITTHAAARQKRICFFLTWLVGWLLFVNETRVQWPNGTLVLNRPASNLRQTSNKQAACVVDTSLLLQAEHGIDTWEVIGHGARRLTWMARTNLLRDWYEECRVCLFLFCYSDFVFTLHFIGVNSCADIEYIPVWMGMSNIQVVWAFARSRCYRRFEKI